jgi:hypothetical protein
MNECKHALMHAVWPTDRQTSERGKSVRPWREFGLLGSGVPPPESAADQARQPASSARPGWGRGAGARLRPISQELAQGRCGINRLRPPLAKARGSPRFNPRSLVASLSLDGKGWPDRKKKSLFPPSGIVVDDHTPEPLGTSAGIRERGTSFPNRYPPAAGGAGASGKRAFAVNGGSRFSGGHRLRSEGNLARAQRSWPLFFFPRQPHAATASVG